MGKLPKDMKAIILRGGEEDKSKSDSHSYKSDNKHKPNFHSIKLPSFANEPNIKAYLAELLDEIMMKYDAHDADIKYDDATPPDNDSTMLVNSTTASKVNPGDIRKLISVSDKDEPSPLPTKAAHKSGIVVDEKTHREVNKTITYSLSHTARSSMHSLVNRGVNEGITGNDVRVISKDPSKTVNVRGTDNHEITLRPLVTVEGVK